MAGEPKNGRNSIDPIVSGELLSRRGSAEEVEDRFNGRVIGMWNDHWNELL